MILVDTSVWIDHLRDASAELSALLEAERVVVHAFVIGELACGNLKNRTDILALLRALPEAPRADDQEIRCLIERHALAGQGLGLIDVHLLAACRMGDHWLWTHDKRLRTAAVGLQVRYG